MNIEERINYYTNNLINFDKKNITIPRSYELSDGENFRMDKIQAFTFVEFYTYLLQKRKIKNANYIVAIIEHFKPFILQNPQYANNTFLCRFGDCTTPADHPFFAKARRLTDKNAMIFRFNKDWHWKSVNFVKQNDIPFCNKIGNLLVWRGGLTGIVGLRESFITKHYNNPKCDVGFTSYPQKQFDKKYLKSHMSMNSQLKYKYLLSLEGNDVATGLKWQLYSNSVVFMKKPTFVSWAMEDKLEPYVHYIPLNDDFSDVDEKISWAESNQDCCEIISKNATQFIEQFRNEDIEKHIHQQILKIYFEKCKFIKE